MNNEPKTTVTQRIRDSPCLAFERGKFVATRARARETDESDGLQEFEEVRPGEPGPMTSKEVPAS
jgi:hypothetical protein